MTSQPEERSVDSSALAPVEPEEFVWPPPSADVLEPVETNTSPAVVDIPVAAPSDPLISDILTSGVTFEWHHAVAVVQQLLSQLAPDGSPAGNLPETWAIRLTASGELDARLQAGPEQPLAGLGTLLQQLLSGRVQPAALRLLVMQATAPDPAISMASLREGLAQWERPNRRQSLANLYEAARGKVAPSATLALPVPALVTRALALEPPPAPAEARAKKGRRRPLPTAAVAAIAGLVFAAVLLTLVMVMMPETADAPASPQAALSEEAAAAAGTEPAVSEAGTRSPTQSAAASTAARPMPQPGAGGPASAGTSTNGRTGTPAASSATRRAPNASAPSTATARTSASLPAATIPGRPTPGASGSARPTPAPSGSESAILPPVPDRVPNPSPVTGSAPRVTTGVPGRLLDGPSQPAPPIYSIGDPGIIAPVALSTLPAQPETGAIPPRLAVLELVIGATGEVESARFLNTDQHYRDRWWISAAKTWKFQPARLNGQPVRFRAHLTFMSGATLGPPVADR